MGSTLGERVRKLLRGVPITKAAKEIGLSQSVLSDIIADKKKAGISATTLVQLCSYFQVSADYLLDLSDTPSVEPDVQAACKYTGLSQEAVEVLHRCQTGQDGGAYITVYDTEEAKETGRDYLTIISALLVHNESRNIWKSAALSIKVDKQQGDPRKEALDALLAKHGLEGVQEFTSALDGYILRKSNAAKFYRQDAADSLKKIVEELGGK